MTSTIHRACARASVLVACQAENQEPTKIVFNRAPELDYDGPPLDEQTAQTLRERFAPQDPTQTVWF